MLPSALMQTAGETNRSRWDQARLRLLILIGAIVALAIICIAVAVLRSAERANDVSATRQEQLITNAINEYGERTLHHLQSVATTPQAVSRIRDHFDATWVDRRLGQWLQNFYGNDALVIFGADDQVEYARSQLAAETASADLRAQLAPAIDLIRGRLSRLPHNIVPVVAPQDLAKLAAGAAVIQRFLGKPAIVAGVAVGSESDLASDHASAPIVFSIGYINNRLLDRVADQLQINGLHMTDTAPQSVGERVIDFSDGEGNPVFSLAWKPAEPGEAVIASVLPFIAVATIAFVLLIILVMLYMRPVGGHSINIGASIGIAVIDSCAHDARDIMRYADMALYRAKNEGRNRACIYDTVMDADLSNRKMLEGALRQAIKSQDLRVVYQPIVNPSGKKLVGVEALARWMHPVHGEIPPARFIPIAEYSGLIVELGEYMLRRACLDGRNWPGLTVSVNVSPLQFRRPDFVERIERIVLETAFEPDRLELELTESTLLGNLENAEMSMLRLKGIGVCFALDDFGTGYSSLLYLRRFPFDRLKIDSSFIRSIEKAADAAAIVHAVVTLGRGLGMRVTAEGVETPEQHLFLRAAGVHALQGYRFGRPVPAAEIDDRLAAPETDRLANPDQEVVIAG